MAQRQWRSDDTSKWTNAFGNGADGTYAPSTGTDALTDSACTGTSGTTSLTATNVSFASGQLILIHQTQGTGAGQWELNKIATYTAGTITTSYALINTYATGAQVVVMPQYSSGNIAGGVTLTGKAWNGTVGGIYVKFCNGTFTIGGTLNNGNGGFRGSNGPAQGESSLGSGASNNQSANGTGGGAALYNSSPGGGGYATAGQAGTSGGGETYIGAGGGTIGIANLTTFFFGGAGGGNGDVGSGGNAAGIILIISKTITVTGTINNTAGNPGTGAGAGGSILLKGQTITLGSSLVTANGGTGGTSAHKCGDGGVGRIHADYSTSISGTTTPTIDSTLDITIAEASSGFFGFM